jgi:hypothetical protein
MRPYRIPLIIGVFAFIVSANTTLNHFFANTPHYYDDGLLSYLFSQKSFFPDEQQRHYFSTHLSSFLWLTQKAQLKGIFVFLGFAFFLAFFHSLFCFSLSWLLLHPQHAFFQDNPKKNQFVALLAGIIGILCRPMAASLLYPHWEILIFCLGLSAYTFYVYQFPIFSILCFLLGLSIREDAGLHYFMVLFLLCAAFIFQKKEPALIKKTALISVFCLLFSLTAFALQKKFYPGDNAFHRIYFDSKGIFSHLNEEICKKRLMVFFYNKSTISLPWILSLLCFLFPSLRFLSIAALSTSAWTLFSLFAKNPVAGGLDIYYSFPLITSYIWPFLSPVSLPVKKIRIQYLFFLLLLVIADRHSRFIASNLIRWDWVKPAIRLKTSLPFFCDLAEKKNVLLEENLFIFCLAHTSAPLQWIALEEPITEEIQTKIKEKGLLFRQKALCPQAKKNLEQLKNAFFSQKERDEDIAFLSAP